MFLRQIIFILALLQLLLLVSCSSTVRFSSEGKNNRKYTQNFKSPKTLDKNDFEEGKFRGIASYYDDKFDGKMTANGEIFNQHELTAAHNTLPFGTIVEVTNLKNGKKVQVRINDRGPFVPGRIIDLSKSAASDIGMLQSGIIEVEIEIISLK